jgi:hypothetical protein
MIELMDKRHIEMAVALAVFAMASCSGADGKAGNLNGTVIGPAVTKVTLASSGGGFHGVPPSGAACDPSQWAYEVTIASHALASRICTVNGPYSDPTSFVLASSDTQLDDSSWASVESALAALTVSTSNLCGADKDSWSLTVDTASGSTLYGDDFYACQKTYAQYVTETSLGNLQTTLNRLLRPDGRDADVSTGIP